MRDKALVAMSGGVDSSVAAYQLIQKGYEVIGITLKLWQQKIESTTKDEDIDPNTNITIQRAEQVCGQLGIRHVAVDYSDIFKNTIVENFANEYLLGRTPNPCVLCNATIKWKVLMDLAEKYEASKIATGHYARIIKIKDQYLLQKGIDPVKDQSYMLWQIPQSSLRQTIFPIGEMNKTEVREIARKLGVSSAETSESMEVCFIPEDNYKSFLDNYKPNTLANIGPGEIIENDAVVGTHPGYTNFTIGQRKGLGLSRPEPRYVKKIDSQRNRIYVGKKEELCSSGCHVSNLNWLLDMPSFPIEAQVQIRYNGTPEKAVINVTNNIFRVEFSQPLLSVTPGQSIVFYQDDLVLGGGIIERGCESV